MTLKPPGSNSVSEDEGLTDSDGQEDKLGRGARGRAKVIPHSVLYHTDPNAGHRNGHEKRRRSKRERKMELRRPIITCFHLFRFDLSSCTSLLYQHSAVRLTILRPLVKILCKQVRMSMSG